MNANPDLADVVVFAINDRWPNSKALKFFIDPNWENAYGINVNGVNVGIVIYGYFMTWNDKIKQTERSHPSDKNFFDMVWYWAALKGGLSNPDSRYIPISY